MADRSILIQGLIELHLKGEGGQQAVASMTKIIAQAKEVEKATGNLGTGATQAAKGIGTLESSFISLGKTVAGYFAAGVVVNFLKDSYLGFARTERQALATENQIRLLGQAAQGAGFRDFISQLSNTSGILDDDLVPAMQRALLAFKDYSAAQEVVGMAAKFAAAGIGDVGSNVEAISRFFQSGQARGLVQFGIDIKGGDEATLSLSEGLKLLRGQLALLPASFDDAQSSINAARIAWDSFKDSIGSGLDKIVSTIQLAGTELGGSFLFFSKKDQEKIASGEKDALDQVMRDAIEAYRNKNVARTELDKQAADRQANIDKQKNAESVKTAAKAEEDKAAKVSELNEKSQQDLLKSRAEFYEEGSDERVALELQLLARVEAASIESAKKIGADTLAIAEFFARERGKIVASKGETATAKDARETAAEFDPRAGFEEVEKFTKEHQDVLTQTTREAAELRNEIASDSLRWDADVENKKTQSALQSSAAIAGALGGLFAKHKGFAIAMAIVNTALGITSVWTDATLSLYEKIAGTIVVAASGLAQISAIRAATLGGGGGAPSGGGIATAPTQSAVNPGQQSRVSSQTASGFQSSTVQQPATVINIGTAFGDRQSMVKLSREIERVTNNNQGNLR